MNLINPINLFITLLVSYSCGLFLQHFNVPAPYLLGSLSITWVFGLLTGGKLIKPIIPRKFQLSVLICMSVLIGGAFSPSIIDLISKWSTTIFTMTIVTVISTFTGYLYLKKIRHYDHNLSILCSLPGGQAEIAAVSTQLVDKDYVVAFCHLVRVTLVFCLTPLILGFIKGEQGIAESNIALNSLSSIFDLSLQTLLQLFCLGIGGYGLAYLARLPMPHLLGPMLLSGGLHISGLISIPRISELVILAQITVASAIGARLSQVKINELSSYLIDAFLVAILTISIFCIAALLLANFGYGDFIKILLAFVPGGLYEVTLLALIFGYDLVFVALHHSIRFILIFLLLPFIVKKS